MKIIIKRFLKPISVLFTKIFFDLDTIKPHLRQVYWEESNAFKWSSSYILKNQIKGDYVEFGVWKGNSFIQMYNQIKDSSKSFYKNNKKKINNLNNPFDQMRFHAFDSFEGLPDSSSNKPIQYFAGNYSSDERVFIDNIKKGGVDINKVTITKGWFNESLNINCLEKIKLNKIAIAYIDCDLFDSTIPVLNFITPLINTGTVLIFDDWFRNGGHKNNGVQGAVLSWLDESKNITLQHYHNSDTRTATFIVRKNSVNNNQENIDCV